jgi:hypothetical protein
MDQHVRRFDADADNARERSDHRMRLVFRSLFQTALPTRFNLTGLFSHQAAAPCSGASRGQGLALGRTERLEALRGLPKRRLEIADAPPRQAGFDPIDNSGLLTNQVLLSRFGRLASSSPGVGIAAIWQCSGSPRSQPRKARFNSSVSRRSVLARRCSRGTATLVE